MNRDRLKGHLDPLIFLIVADGPLHGYAVIDELRTRSDQVFDLAEGTAYPTLHRLEVAGYLSSEGVTSAEDAVGPTDSRG